MARFNTNLKIIELKTPSMNFPIAAAGTTVNFATLTTLGLSSVLTAAVTWSPRHVTAVRCRYVHVTAFHRNRTCANAGGGEKALKACYTAVDGVYKLDFSDGPPLLHTFDRGRPASTAVTRVTYVTRNARVTTVTRTRTLRLQWEHYFRQTRHCPAVRERSYTLGCVRVRVP